MKVSVNVSGRTIGSTSSYSGCQRNDEEAMSEKEDEARNDKQESHSRYKKQEKSSIDTE